ncbi:MAG TPA: hypothetical protein VGG06_00980 [Thermoanaerobaculia bacterium]|jgi:hypothetical protein
MPIVAPETDLDKASTLTDASDSRERWLASDAFESELTEHFGRAAKKAIAATHAKGHAVYGQVGDRIVEVKPPARSSAEDEDPRSSSEDR